MAGISIKTLNWLEVTGVLALSYVGIKALSQSILYTHKHFIRAPKRRNAITKEKGRWALVTGATDGIGKAYAIALAQRGLNIFLISRDGQKLENCAAQIKTQYNVQVKYIAVDFTAGPEIYNKIAESIQGYDIGVLVNNVGISYPYPEMYLDLPEKEKMVSALIKANVISVAQMCLLVMPQMAKRRSGVVINVSSAAALFPSPMLTLYVATKAFVEKFSDELRNEYDDKGLVIQTVLPGYVATKLAKIGRASWMAPSPDTFVASALNRVGVDDHTTGYYAHTIMVNFIKAIESICPQFAVYMILRQMKNIRSRALKSQAKRSQPT